MHHWIGLLCIGLDPSELWLVILNSGSRSKLSLRKLSRRVFNLTRCSCTSVITSSSVSSSSADSNLCPHGTSLAMDAVIAELDHVERICAAMVKRFQSKSQIVSPCEGGRDVLDRKDDGEAPNMQQSNPISKGLELVIDLSLTGNILASKGHLKTAGSQLLEFNPQPIGTLEPNCNAQSQLKVNSSYNRKVEFIDLTDEQEDVVQYEPYVPSHFNAEESEDVSQQDFGDIWKEMELSRSLALDCTRHSTKKARKARKRKDRCKRITQGPLPIDNLAIGGLIKDSNLPPVTSSSDVQGADAEYELDSEQKRCASSPFTSNEADHNVKSVAEQVVGKPRTETLRSTKKRTRREHEKSVTEHAKEHMHTGQWGESEVYVPSEHEKQEHVRNGVASDGVEGNAKVGLEEPFDGSGPNNRDASRGEKREDVGRPVAGKAEKEAPHPRLENRCNGENVEYEPYVWKTQPGDTAEEHMQNPELADIWQEMALQLACTTTSFPSPQFTAQEGSLQQSRRCSHEKVFLQDDVGLICETCGFVKQDIESIFIPQIPSTPRKQIRNGSAAGLTTDLSNGTSSLSKIRPECVAEDEFLSSPRLELHQFFEDHLHAHQREGFRFLTNSLVDGKRGNMDSEGCILAHAPGTGKSCLVISFIQSFLTKFPEGRPVIVAPKIMLKPWTNQFEVWNVEKIPTLNLSECTPGGRNSADTCDFDNVIHGSAIVRLALRENRLKLLQDWYCSRGVLLVSYTLFAGLVTAGVDGTSDSLDHQISQFLLDGPNLVVLDEGHFPRNAKTNVLKALRRVRTKRKILLSGTLFQNSVKELYNLLKLVRHSFISAHPEHALRLGAHRLDIQDGVENTSGQAMSKSLGKFNEALEEKIFMEEIGDPLEHFKPAEQSFKQMKVVIGKLQSLTAPFVHFYSGKILEGLPGLREFAVFLNLTETQQQAISEISQDLVYMQKEHMVLSACIHPSLLKLPEIKEEDATPQAAMESISSQECDPHKGAKMTFVLELVYLCKAAGEKLLIFCQTLNPFKLLGKVLTEKLGWTKDVEFLQLDGSMQEEHRQVVIDRFNCKDTEAVVMLASTKACKEGISLVGASRVVIMDVPKNPSVVRQAVSRAFRIGQKRKVYVYRLVAYAVPEEQTIFEKSMVKEQLSMVLLDPAVNPDSMNNFLQEVKSDGFEDEILRSLIAKESCAIIHSVHIYNAKQSC